MAGVVALLAFAVPASIAVASLAGAYVVIALLAGSGAVGVLWNARRRGLDAAASASTRRPLIRIAVLAALYAVAVTLIHAAG